MANKTIGHLRYSIGKRKTNPSDKDSEEKYYCVAQAQETLDIKLLAQHMADHGSPFSVGTINGVLTDAVEHIVEFLRQGYSVKLDGLAQFRYSFQGEGVDDPEDAIPSNTVKKIKVNAYVAQEATSKMNTNVEYEYAMTRAAQAAAKKAAKAKLAADGRDADKPKPATNDDDDDNGGGDVTE